jgi:hypothetical protein
VESAPGRKDPALIRAFIRAVREFDGTADMPQAEQRLPV